MYRFLIVLLSIMVSCSCGTINSANTSLMLETAIDLGFPPLVEKTLQSSEKYNAYKAWKLVDQSIIEILNPILKNEKVKISDLKVWTENINKLDGVSDIEIKITQLAVNQILSYLPSDKLADSLPSDVKTILTTGIGAIQSNLEEVLAKYDSLKTAVRGTKAEPVVKTKALKFEYTRG